jgi:hypothetical protein
MKQRGARGAERAGAGVLAASSVACAACALAAAPAGCSSSDPSAPSPSSEAGEPVARADGSLTEWIPEPALTTPRANHCSVVANGFVVVLGGNYKPAGAKDFVTLDDVLVAKIQPDGSLGAWQAAGETPGPVSSCTAAADGKDIYLVDGIFDDDSLGGKVRRATLGDDGSLGAWQDLGALPDGVRVFYSTATVDHGVLRAFLARLPDDGDAISLVSAPIAPGEGGALGAWQETKWSAGFRGQPQYAYATTDEGSFVYALGGYAGADRDNAVLAEGAGAAIDASGAPGAAFAVPALPKPTAFGKAMAVDDWIFVTGGKDAVFGDGRADVFAAHVEAGGALGAFTAVAALPEGRTSHALALSGEWLYLTGGGYDAGGLDTVFAARVRSPPAE